MKRVITVFASLFLCFCLQAYTPEIKPMLLSDGEEIMTLLCLPENDITTLVIGTHGTGPHSHLNKRGGFNFYEEIAKGFCEQNVGFFTYDRRGVTVGETPPLYVEIDSVKYKKYTPLQEAEDVETLINTLKKEERFRNTKIIVYGLSEGTITAALVAERKKAPVDAIFLHGYAHENMYDIILWQNEGHGVMRMLNIVFDKNKDNKISREEYEAEGEQEALYRKNLFQDATFEQMDVTQDNVIDVQDIRTMRMYFHDLLMEKVITNDYYWIRSNYFNITPQWFKAHFELEPNKSRLLRVDIPVYVFHGADDANVPAESVKDLEERFRVSGKSNLHTYVFDSHNHDLNFTDWLLKQEWPEGYQTLFKCAGEF